MSRLISIPLSLLILVSCGQRKTAGDNKDNKQDSIAYLNKSIAFINEIMSQELKDSIFILEDKPFSFDYFDCLNEVLTDTATYSKQEIQNLKAKKFYKVKRWEKQNFPNLKFVSADTVKSIFEDNGKGWDYFYKHIGREFHTISYPIFLRNFTYCLFYNDNSCGWLCGTGRLTLYKYEKDKWTEVKSYCNWIS